MKNSISRGPVTAVLLAIVLAAAFLASSGVRHTQAVTDVFDWKTTPAGKLIIDASTALPAVAPLTVNFVRSPDADGPNGGGRYLIAVNSGYGVKFTEKSKGQQTLSVIDLNHLPDAQVVQTIYFPSPQSASFGLVFDPRLQPDGRYRMYVSGGFENKIWLMGFDPKAAQPISPASKPDDKITAPFIDLSAASQWAPSPNYNDNTAAVYPTGIALSPDGETVYSANNLGDTLGIFSDLRNTRWIDRLPLRPQGAKQFVYPYDVKLLTEGKRVSKAYVSLWGAGSVAVVDAKPMGERVVTYIETGRHPTAMLINKTQTRLFVVNSNADTVTVIDTRMDKVVESINVRLAETEQVGASPEGLALSDDEKTLYVANAHANAIAIVKLAATASERSKLLGLIPTGKYPSAVAVVGNKLFIGNGKGTGMENSSNIVTDTGLFPNMPNKNFPGDAYNKRGEYSAAVVSGNISLVDVPDEKQLFAHTQKVMQNNGLMGREKRDIFPGGKSPFKHVIYVIRENRTYDQVFGDLEQSGDGRKADGDASVAIFGSGESAKSPKSEPQNITPNARTLAMRFGLFDRFFVNAEASPDGHNWSTAAFSNDYVDKAFRWDYSGRGRTYDYEGFNRLPSYNPPSGQPPVSLPPVFDIPATAEDVANFQRRYVPYLNGARDIAEPETLYLWDAAQRAGLTYRNYGEFVATVSADDLNELNTRKGKHYPDISATLTAFATKKSLETHFSSTARNFDMDTPDIMTTDSYKAARQQGASDPAIIADSANADHRGNSRFGAWQADFKSYVADRAAGRGDKMPNLSIVRLSNDHTSGLHRDIPTPQFYVAENDYALGRLVQEVSGSPYWADTAIFVVEDDAQDGPDHVDAHRSPALVISAYNRPGALVHEFHNTVSLIRTLELCLGIPPMNFLDTHATPMDIFTARADLTPYVSVLPEVALDNLFPPERPSTRMAYYMDLTDRQDLSHPDMANPRQLNEIIWFSVRGQEEMPRPQRLPAFELMTAGVKRTEAKDDDN